VIGEPVLNALLKLGGVVAVVDVFVREGTVKLSQYLVLSIELDARDVAGPRVVGVVLEKLANQQCLPCPSGAVEIEVPCICGGERVDKAGLFVVTVYDRFWNMGRVQCRRCVDNIIEIHLANKR